MNIELINGDFSQKEAFEIVTILIHAKIRFHESKIKISTNETEILQHERYIKKLQHEFYEVSQSIMNRKKRCYIESLIKIKL